MTQQNFTHLCLKNILQMVLLCTLLAACESTTHVSDTLTISAPTSGNNITELAKGNPEIGKTIKTYEIPLVVDTPRDAVLKIDFKVKDTGHCMTTYEPTVFYLNGKEIIQFDFRRFFLKKYVTQEIKLKAAQFITGKNTLKIETGFCQYDIDVLKLNSLKLIF